MTTNIEAYNARRRALASVATDRSSSSRSSSTSTSSKATPPVSGRAAANGVGGGGGGSGGGAAGGGSGGGGSGGGGGGGASGNHQNQQQQQHQHKLDPKDQARIKAVLSKYQKILAEEHAYIVTHALRAARWTVNKRAEVGDESRKRREALVDEVSPFKDMRPIEVIGSPAGTTVSSKDKDLTVGRFALRHYPHKPQNSTPEIKLQVKGKLAPGPGAKGIPPLPKYHAYTTLRNNILAEDDEVMRYFPYFGEDAAENDVLYTLNLEEAFVDRTKNAQEENMRAEKGIVFVDYAHDFLHELGLDLNTVTQYLIGSLSFTGWNRTRRKLREKYLPEDFDFSEPKIRSAIKKLTPVTLAQIENAEAVCAVFMKVADFSLWEVAKRGDASVRDSIAPQRLSGGNKGSVPGGKTAADAVAMLTGGNPQPYSLESYGALNCLYCYMHECPFHVNITKDSAFFASQAKFNLNGQNVGSRKHAFEEGAQCSKGCFIDATDEERATRTPWTKAQTQLLQAAFAVLRENPRASCLLASVINKYCYEIDVALQEERRRCGDAGEHTLTAPNKNLAPVNLKRKRSPKPGEYPPDCHKTPHAAERSNYRPCTHSGPCTSDCKCVRDKVMCEKACACEPDCPRRWRGCTCAASGKACTLSQNCPCVKWNRECDPDLCSDCGAAETLSPTNRYDERLAKSCCQNVSLQRNVPKRTLLGVSGVSGLGLFIGETVKKGTFLGEYKGEIVTNDEAERRGKLYDKRGVSFLFNLNKTSVIDATRAGNKFRFVNHYKKPNCFAKVLFANCTHRIGMFAKRDLVAGEELYFDYGYNSKSVQFIAQEPDYIYQPSVEKNAAAAARKRNTANKGNWNTGVTARTLKQRQLKELEKPGENGAGGSGRSASAASSVVAVGTNGETGGAAKEKAKEKETEREREREREGTTRGRVASSKTAKNTITLPIGGRSRGLSSTRAGGAAATSSTAAATAAALISTTTTTSAVGGRRHPPAPPSIPGTTTPSGTEIGPSSGEDEVSDSDDEPLWRSTTVAGAGKTVRRKSQTVVVGTSMATTLTATAAKSGKSKMNVGETSWEIPSDSSEEEEEEEQADEEDEADEDDEEDDDHDDDDDDDDQQQKQSPPPPPPPQPTRQTTSTTAKKSGQDYARRPSSGKHALPPVSRRGGFGDGVGTSDDDEEDDDDDDDDDDEDEDDEESDDDEDAVDSADHHADDDDDDDDDDVIVLEQEAEDTQAERNRHRPRKSASRSRSRRGSGGAGAGAGAGSSAHQNHHKMRSNSGRFLPSSGGGKRRERERERERGRDRTRARVTRSVGEGEEEAEEVERGSHGEDEEGDRHGRGEAGNDGEGEGGPVGRGEGSVGAGVKRGGGVAGRRDRRGSIVSKRRKVVF